MKISNRSVIFRYGLGCPWSDNCFSCDQPDCKSSSKRFDRHKVIADQNVIYGGKPEFLFVKE